MNDLISRQAAIDAIESHIRTAEEPYQLTQTDKVLNHAFEIAASCVYNLPSAQPEKRTEERTKTHSCDLVDRQAAIDAECEVCQIAPKKERGHNCTYYVHGCKEIECLRAMPSAQPKTQLSTEDATFGTTFDCISRQAAIDAVMQYCPDDDGSCSKADRDIRELLDDIENLPSAQTEIIRCRKCKFASGDSRICIKFGHSQIGELDFCAWAERRTDEAD